MLCRQNSLNIAYTQLADRLERQETKGQHADRPTKAYGDAFLAANSAALIQLLDQVSANLSSWGRDP